MKPIVNGYQPATCPRCGAGFECGAQAAGPCACTQVRLTSAQQASLRQRYEGCLCARCLREVAAEPPPTPMQAG